MVLDVSLRSVGGGADPKVAFAAAEKPSRVDGIWLGTLETLGAKLRLQVQVKSDRAEKEYCAVDSLDRGVSGLPCANVRFEGNRFSFDVPVVRGQWSGTLSASGSQLNGKWSQGADLPLNLTHQAVALAPEKPKAPKYDHAMAPVTATDLKPVLDRDLATTLKRGTLAPETSGGVVIGFIDHGARQIIAYGNAKQNSIFEIGSISKTFTGLILAQMVEQNKVKLDQSVRELLPSETVAKPAGPEITLLDLATHHSGLPRMPDNFNPSNLQDPYADYTPANLYAFIAKHGVLKPAGADFSYSNLGVGLLGQALSDQAETTYPKHGSMTPKPGTTGITALQAVTAAMWSSIKRRIVRPWCCSTPPLAPKEALRIAWESTSRNVSAARRRFHSTSERPPTAA